MDDTMIRVTLEFDLAEMPGDGAALAINIRDQLRGTGDEGCVAKLFDAMQDYAAVGEAAFEHGMQDMDFKAFAALSVMPDDVGALIDELDDLNWLAERAGFRDAETALTFLRDQFERRAA